MTDLSERMAAALKEAGNEFRKSPEFRKHLEEMDNAASFFKAMSWPLDEFTAKERKK